MKVKTFAGGVLLLAASFYAGCNDVTGVDDEFGEVELLYEFTFEKVSYPYLVDASIDGEFHLIWGHVEGKSERALFYLEPETGKLATIVSSSELTFYGPRLSPDKKNVFFSELSGIYVVPVAGGEPRLVYGSGLNPTPVQWLDEDTFLMYVIEDRWVVNTLNINTLEVETLFDLDDLDLVGGVWSVDVWAICLSPDRKFLSLNGMRSKEEFGPSESFSRIYDTRTLEYKEYVRGENGIGYLPDGPWSPDGTKIFINVSNPDAHLGYFDFATSDDVMVFRSKKLDIGHYPGIWSPDGKKLLASEDRDDNILRVFALDAE